MIKIIITNQKPKQKKLLHKSSKAIHKYIISLPENKFLELDTGFALIGHEYKILVGSNTYKRIKAY